MEKCTLQAIMWGVAGSLNLFQRTAFSREVCQILSPSITLPAFNETAPSLIDFEIALPAAEWNQWKKKVP